MKRSAKIRIRKIISHKIVDQKIRKINNKLMYWSKSLINLKFKTKSKTDILNVNTNNKYYRIENVDKLQKF